MRKRKILKVTKRNITFDEYKNMHICCSEQDKEKQQVMAIEFLKSPLQELSAEYNQRRLKNLA